jgi:hypothetical protein
VATGVAVAVLPTTIRYACFHLKMELGSRAEPSSSLERSCAVPHLVLVRSCVALALLAVALAMPVAIPCCLPIVPLEPGYQAWYADGSRPVPYPWAAIPVP